jgi:hypothetical protein
MVSRSPQADISGLGLHIAVIYTPRNYMYRPYGYSCITDTPAVITDQNRVSGNRTIAYMYDCSYLTSHN